MAKYLSGNQKTLVDSFFFDHDQRLLDDFRKRLEKVDRRAQLMQVSGVHDENVLDHLLELGIDPETMAAMSVVPLVAVAWADGSVQAREREVILDAAKKSGIQPQDGRYPILERWLAEPPRKEMIDAWELYLRGLCQKLTPPEVENLKHDLLDLARSVARAAGGFLGLGEKISASERDVLDELEGAFSA